jgi:hypothetical protein
LHFGCWRARRGWAGEWKIYEKLRAHTTNQPKMAVFGHTVPMAIHLTGTICGILTYAAIASAGFFGKPASSQRLCASTAQVTKWLKSDLTMAYSNAENNQHPCSQQLARKFLPLCFHKYLNGTTS